MRLLVFNERCIYTSKRDYAPNRRGVIGLHNPLRAQSNVINSGVATWGQGGRVPPLTARNLPTIGKKREKIRKNRGKKEKESERKGKNWDGSFTLPLLIDRAGYATSY